MTIKVKKLTLNNPVLSIAHELKTLKKDNKTKVKVIRVGDWIDVYSRTDIKIKGPIANTLNKKRTTRTVEFSNERIPLGFCLKLPKGFEAILVVRSSTFDKLGIIQANGFGVIDETYCGNLDEWQLNAIALRDTVIPANTKLAQFRIQPSQYATWWQKLKWNLTSHIYFNVVDDLGSENRGGFGSTDKNN